MKTSRAKSFRLHHMSRTGSLRKTSQSFMDPDQSFKLAALNSVTRGIKMANLSMITGDDLNKLRVEPNQPKEAQQFSAHCSLMDVRVRYDEMRKKFLQSDSHIAKQKEEIKKLQTFKHEYEEKKDNGKSKVVSLQQKLQDIRDLLDETQTEMKVLQHMRVRYHTDRVVYDQRKYDLEQWLICQRKQLSIYRREGLTVAEGTDRTAKIYTKLQSEILQEHLQRQTHIRNIETMIEEKMSLINANQQREAELGEIASRAIQDKGQDEKHWRMVYLTHVFVNRMLRHKIDIQMEKFKTVEQAFMTIKTATGVSDVKNLIHKYLSKEIVYGELLGKIADNERTINDLKNEGERLFHESKSLEGEKEVLQSIKIKEQDLHDTIRQFEAQDDKCLKAYEMTRKVKQWVHRQLKKLSFLPDIKGSEPENITQAIKQFLVQIEKTAEIVEGDTLFKVQGDPGHQQKIVRILPKRSRKNSIGEEIFDVDQEDLYSGANHEQSDYVNSQHDELIHANERFMKDLRKKFQEERNILLQKKDIKAKNPKPAEMKKEEQ